MKVEVDAQEQRLRWQCRRGMLELDLLLQSFLENKYYELDDLEQQDFNRLLDIPDQELLELLMGRLTHKEVCFNEPAIKIRQANRS